LTQNPFKDFNPVPGAQELLDIAFKQASKSNPALSQNAPNRLRARKKENERVQVSVDYLVERFEKIIHSVPNLEALPPFFRDLSHLLVNNDQLKLNLGKLQGAVKVIQKLRRELGPLVRMAKNPYDAEQQRVKIYGRVSSVIRKQAETLEFLEGVRKVLRKIPVVDLEELSVVVAGYPNVGKSSLVSQISTGKPEIAEYPFTTKEINIGHYYSSEKEDRFTRFARFQVIDTPGILDRPMASRNEIEKQAILALQTLANGILFMFDPTPTCGYDIQSQVNLFHEVRANFCTSTNIQLIIVLNKMDLATEEEIQVLFDLLGDIEGIPYFKVNSMTGENTKEVIEYILRLVKERYREGGSRHEGTAEN